MLAREDTSEAYNDKVKYTMFYGLLIPTLLFVGHFMYYMRKELVKVVYRAYRGTTQERYCRIIGCGLKDIEPLIKEANKEIEKENIQLEMKRKNELQLKERVNAKETSEAPTKIYGTSYLKKTNFGGRNDTQAIFYNSRIISDPEDPSITKETISK